MLRAPASPGLFFAASTGGLALTPIDAERRAVGQPGVDGRVGGSPHLRREAVMARQPVECELQHDLGRARRSNFCAPLLRRLVQNR
jgi:hypothetical protein